MTGKNRRERISSFVTSLFSNTSRRTSKARRSNRTQLEHNPNSREVRPLETLEDRLLLTYVNPDDLIGTVRAGDVLGEFEEIGGAGAAGASQLQVSVTGDDRVAGAIEQVLAHPNNADLLYAASVNGGVWRTTNGTSSNPTWEPLTDDVQLLDNTRTPITDADGNPTFLDKGLSIGAIAFDLTDIVDATPFQSIVAVTGVRSSYGPEATGAQTDTAQGGNSGRILTTHDGGNTWFSPESNGIQGEHIVAVTLESDPAAPNDRSRDRIVVASSGDGTGGGGGLFRSTDGGTNFTPINFPAAQGGGSTAGTSFFSLVADPTAANPTLDGRLYAAAGDGANGGIFRSDDFGASWIRISDTSAALQGDLQTGINNGVELTVHPVTGRLYVATLHNSQLEGVFYASDADENPPGGPQWTSISVPLIPVSRNDITNVGNNGNGNTIAGPSDTGVGPIHIQTSGNHDLNDGDRVVIRNTSTPNGANINGTWTVSYLTANIVTLNGSGFLSAGQNVGGGEIVRIEQDTDQFDNTATGGDVHLSIATDPENHNIVYVGLDELEFGNLIGGSAREASLWRADVTRSENLGTTAVLNGRWDYLAGSNASFYDSGAGTANNTTPHRGSRSMTFDANGNLIQSDDGGVFRRTSPRSNNGDWSTLAGNLGTFEYHSIAYDTTSNAVIAGANDLGTQQGDAAPGEFDIVQGTNVIGPVFNPNQSNRTDPFTIGGSGADVAVGQLGNGNSIRYFSRPNLLGNDSLFSREFNAAGNQVGGTSTRGLQTTDGTNVGQQITTAFAVNALHGDSILVGASNGVYESFNSGDTVDNASQVGGVANLRVTPNAAGPLAYGGKSSNAYGNNRYIIFAGDTNGDIWVRTQAAGQFASVEAQFPGVLSGDPILDIEINPDEWTEAYAVTEDRVYRITVSASDPAGSTPTITGIEDITRNLDADFLNPANPDKASEIFSLEYINGSGTGIHGLVVGTSTGVYATTVHDLKNIDANTGGVRGSNWFHFGTGLPDAQVRDMAYDQQDDVLILGTLGRGAWKMDEASRKLTPKVSLSVDVTQIFEDDTAGPQSATVTATLSRPNPHADILVTLENSGNAIFTEPGGAAGSTPLAFDDDDYDRIITNPALTDPTNLNAPGPNQILIPAGQLTGTAVISIEKDANTDDDFNDEDDELIQIAIDDVEYTARDAIRDIIDGVPPTPGTGLAPEAEIGQETVSDSYASATHSVDVFPLAVPDDSTAVTSTITIAEDVAGGLLATDIVDDIDLQLNITHDQVQDLTISLLHVDSGKSVNLFVAATGDPAFDLPAGANLINTVFDDEAPEPINDGLAPFTNRFKLQGSAMLSEFDGETVVGDWQLTVTDSVTGNSGQLNSWSLTINRADPTALPQVTIIDDDDTPLVRFAAPNPVAITEDGSLTNDMSAMTNVSTVTVELVHPVTGTNLDPNGAPYVSGRDVTVTISVDPSSTASAADNDYTLADTTIVIPAGQNTATTTITAHEEAGLVLDEFDETVVLNIDSVVNGIEDANTANDGVTTVEESTATVTIEDRDPEVEVSITIDQATITEGGTATVTATLNNVSAKEVVVDFEQTGANAEADDFTLAPITIPAGSLSATGTLTADEDTTDEDDIADTETLNLRITAATLTNAVVTTNGALSDNISVGIVDNDDAPLLTLSVDEITIDEAPGSVTRTATVTASLPTGIVSEKTITVTLAIDDASDTAEPADYMTGPLTFTILPGATSGSVMITTVDDMMDEDPETVLIDIASLTNAQHDGLQEQTITIVDDDALPEITLTVDGGLTSTITEDPAGTPTATITATLNGGNPLQVSEKDVAVELTLNPLLTANEGDYTTNPAAPPLVRTITIPAGSSTATMTLTAFDDDIDEFDEDVEIDITNVVNGTEATPQQVTVTIVDNEPDPNIVLSVDLVGIRETPAETATVTATLVDGIVSEKDITVDLAYNAVTTATPGVDFNASSLTIVIPAGFLSASQTVTSIRDSLEEFDERVVLDIDSVTNGTEVGDQQVTITILEQKPEADEVLGIFEEQGGASVIDGQVMNVTPQRRVTGAIEDILAHPTDPDILYVGSINGGIWKTENATATNPNWVPQTDDLESLSIGAIEFDIADPTYQSLVAGTGRFSSFGSTGGLQGRVYVTNDGGDTWETPGSIGLAGENISGVARQGDVIVVTSSENGGGIFRSIDRGANFSPISDADFVSGVGFSSTNFFDLVTDPTTPGRLYAAAEDTGIYRSDDFGATWTKITGIGGGGNNSALNADITNSLNNNLEMAVHPGTGRLYLGVVLAGQVGGIYYTSDGDTAVPTWIEMDVPLLPVTPATPITAAAGSDIVITAVGHGLNNGDTVIVRNVQGNTNANGFWTVTRIDADTFSLNGSVSGPAAYVNNTGEVVLVTNPSPSFKDIDESGSQGRIHFSITTDPTDHNIVYIGGDRQEIPNQIGDNLYGGSIFRGDASITRNPNAVPSPQWDHITNNEAFDPGAGTANNTGTHADSRDMTFDAAGNLIEVDDGGIFKRTSPRSNTGDWFSLAGDLGTVEYHSIGYDTISDLIIGGTQDNGTHAQLSPGSNTFRMINGGDGGDVAIDSITLAGSNQSIRYISSQFLGGFHSRVYDAAGNQVSRTNRSLTETDGSTLQAQFYTPIALNAVDPTAMILGAVNGVYESFNQGDTVDNAGPGIRATGSVAGPLAYGGFSAVNGNNPFVIYAGDSSGRVHTRTVAAGAFVQSPDFGGQIRDVEIDPAEWMTAFAVNSDSVQMTTDAGAAWTDVTGNLFGVGAGSIYSIQYVNGVVDGLVIGTDRGAFATTFDGTGAPKDWFRFGSGLPDVQIRDMDYDAADDVLILGTLGRGAWRLQDASLFLEPQVVISTDKIVVPEDNSQVVTVTARLSRESDVDVIVNLGSNGTATFTEPTGTNAYPDDYSRLTGQIIIPAGQLIGTTTIVPLNDDVHEVDEVAEIEVTSVVNAQLYLRQQASTDSLDYVNSTVTAIADSSTATSTITVPDVGYITDVNVRLNVNHPQTSDLTITLTGPDGTEILLQDRLGSGGNLIDTSFDDAAGTSITAGDNPFTGLFIPAEALAAFNGRGAAGDWTLSITDNVAGSEGDLLDWTLTIDRVLEPTILPQIMILDNDPEPLVRMSVVDNSVNEDPGAGTDHQTTVTFELFHPVTGNPIISGRPVVVDLVVDASSTATDVDDFSFPAQITIPAGDPSVTATFTAVDDDRDEDSENAVINIAAVTGGVEDGSQSVDIEIVDDDNPPAVTLTFSTLTLTENSGGVATVTASLPTGVVSDKDIDVTLAIDPSSTATLGSDYSTSPLTITILAGQSSGTFTFSELDDTSDEDDQTIIVDIGSLVNAVHDGLQGETITIIDDDPEPFITLTTDVTTITEDTGDVATVTASLPTGIVSEKTITVTLAVDPSSTANAGADYTNSALTITIDPGDSSGTVTFTEQSDVVDEFDETIIVDIASTTNAQNDGTQQQTITIVDADPEPAVNLSITPANIAEAGGVATVTASLPAGVTSEKPITVNLGFAGLAVNGVDFNASATQLTIAPGDNSSTDSGSQVTLTPINDNLNEVPENIDVSITGTTNAVQGINLVTTTIVDDDPEPTVTLDAVPGKIQEGTSGQFVATLSVVSGRDVTVNLVASGTATAGADYSAPLQIVIPAGALSASTTVSAVQDALSEDEESIFMDIDSVVGAIEVGTQRDVMIIENDDNPPQLIFLADKTVIDEQGETVTFTATLEQPSGRDVIVDFSVAGSATGGGVDFTDPFPAQIIIPGDGVSLSRSMTISSVADIIDEFDENFTVTVDNITNAVAASGQRTDAHSNATSIPINDLSTVTSDIDVVGFGTVVSVQVGINVQHTDAEDVTAVLIAPDGTRVTLVNQAAVTRNGQFTNTTFADGAPALSGSSPFTGTFSPQQALSAVAGQPVTGTWQLEVTDNSLGSDGTLLGWDLSITRQLPTFQPQTVTITDDDALEEVFFATLPTITEGDSGLVTVELSAAAEKDITVDLAILNAGNPGEATQVTDFDVPSGLQIVIPAGATSGTIDITTVEDFLDEFPEVVLFDIIGVTNAVERDVNEVGTITIVDAIDTDDEVNLSIRTDSSSLPETGGATTITVSLDQVSGKDVTVDLALNAGNATHFSDFLVGSTSLSIPAGQLSVTTTFTVISDLLDEFDEVAVLDLVNPVNAKITTGQRSITIVDDDPLPIVSISTTDAQISEDGASATFNIDLNRPAGRDVIIDVAISGTATLGLDYSQNPALTQFTIAAGDTNASFTITGLPDNIDEDVNGENVTVSIASVVNGIENGVQEATTLILDTDATPSVTLDASPSPISEIGGISTYTATLAEVSGQNVTITLGVDPASTATHGTDFQVDSFIIFIPAGSLSGTTTVRALQDTVDEDNELIVLNVVAAQNTTLSGSDSATVVITDENPAPLVTLDVLPTNISEQADTAQLTATLSTASERDVTVNLAIVAGSEAAIGLDYNLSSAQIVIPAGQTTGSVTITSIVDGIDEVDEQVTFEIASVVNGTEDGQQTATTTILDDNPTPSLTLSGPLLPVTEDGGVALITATLSGESSRDVVIDFGFGGTATNGVDYNPTQTQLVIPAGQLSRSFDLIMNGDVLDEPQETAVVTVTGITNAAGLGVSNVVLIRDEDAPPTVNPEIDQATISEVGGQAVVTARLDAVSALPITVLVNVSGTALGGGVDYSSTGTQFVFQPGETEKSITFTAIDDGLDEQTESVIVTVTGLINVQRGIDTVQTAIVDDDPEPNVTLAADVATITETGSVTFTATLSAVSGQDVTVDLAQSGSATLDDDYTIDGLQIVIPAGSTEGTVTATAVADGIDEIDETLIIDISGVTGASEATPQTATVTITDDDPQPNVTLSIDQSTIAEDGGTATITATLSAASSHSVTVNFDVSGTATAGSDFSGPMAIVIPAGSLSATATITAAADTLDEFDETVVVDMRDAVNAVENGVQQVTTTITDADIEPTVRIAVDAGSETVAEDGGVASFTLTLSAVSGKMVTVDLTAGGAALPNGVDFTGPATQVVFQPGDTEKTVSITAVQDALDEFDEPASIEITSISNATASGPQSASTTIFDDDAQPSVSIQASTTTVLETINNSVITVTLSEVSGRDVTVPLTTAGSATPGADYQLTPTTLTIPAGQLSAMAVLNPTPDDVDEDDEDVVVSIGTPTWATVGTPSATTITIVDTDDPPTVTLSAAATQIAESGGIATFSATLDAASEKEVVVKLRLAGDATPGADFTVPASLDIVIAPGDLSGSLQFPIINDTIDEFNEFLTIEFDTVVNGVENIVQQVSTQIIDDDVETSVSLSASAATISEDGAASSTITATLNQASGKDVVVTLGYAGTATNGVDYLGGAGSITIPAGALSGSLTLTATADTLDEDDETIQIDIVTVANSVENTVGGEQQATVTIIDDDPQPTVSLAIDTNTISEDAGSATVTAQLSQPSGKDVTLTFDLSGNASGTDYSLTPQTVVIPAGSTTASLTLTATEDLLDEHNETAIIAVTALGNATYDGNDVSVTITDNDALPAVNLSVQNATVAEGNITQIVATLSAVSGRDVTVTIATDGTAAIGSDYNVAGSQIVIPAGLLSSAIDLTAIADGVDEEDTEDVTATITSVDWAAAATTQATTSIVDGDAPPVVSLSFDDASIAEAGAGTTLRVSLDTVSARDVSVDLSIAGTASPGSDFVLPNLTVLIPAGSLSAEVPFVVTDDGLVEGDETIEVGIASAVNATGMPTASTSITDDDAQTLTVTINRSAANEVEDTVTATVYRNTADTSAELVVSLASNDTSEATVPATITIPAGANSADFNIDPQNDGILDGTQTATVTATAPGFIAGTSSIDIEDAMVGLNLIVDSNSAAENGATAITIRAVTDSAAIGPQTVSIQVTDASGGLGLSTADYTLGGNSVSTFDIQIPDGGTEGTVVFQVVDDAIVEALETARVSIVAVSSGLSLGANDTQDIQIADNDSATISIDDVTVAEGSGSDITTATFTVTLNNTIDTQVGVDFTTSDGTASFNDGDYVTTSGILSFSGTANEQLTITVPINSDEKVELDESFDLLLSNIVAPGRSISFSKATGSATITNDDSASLSIDDVTLNEGNSGTTDFTFTVTLDAEVDADVTVDIASAFGTADATDLTPANATLTFNGNGGVGQTQTFTVAVNADTVVELTETFNALLSNLDANGRAGGANFVSISDATGIGTIVNDDAATLSVADVASAEGNSGSTNFTFTVTLDSAIDIPISVNYLTGDGTATTASGDYVSGAGILNFVGNAGETQQVTVSVTGDSLIEVDETFLLNLVAPQFGNRNIQLPQAPATGTIVNDDNAGITISDASVTETNSGTTTITFDVTLDGPVDAPVTVNYQTADDSAQSGNNDYTAVSSGSLTFAANAGGPQTQQITIEVSGDDTVELDESFFVNLTDIEAGNRSVQIDDAQAVGTILNDDTATISIADVSVAEGDSGTTVATVTLTLTANVDTDVSLQFDTADGTAKTADGDYSPFSGQVTFAAGTGTTQTVMLNIAGDEKVEATETFLANLTQLAAAGRAVTIADNQATVSIGNDDSATVSVADVSVTEGDAGTTTLDFVVTLDSEVDTNVRVNYNTSDNTARTADSDYVAAINGQLLFPANSGPGAATQTVSVTVNGDNVHERDEIVRFLLSALSAANRSVTLSDASADGTILNDDDATLSITDATIVEGDSGATNLTFDVTLTGQVDTEVAVTYLTTDGTATAADSDFRAVTGAQLMFAANGPATQTRTINIAVNGDEKVETSEAFGVLLSAIEDAGRNVTFAGGVDTLTGTGTITNDDSAVLSIADVAIAEGNAGSRNLVFTATLDSEVSSPVTVDFATSDISAQAGDDYVAANGQLTFTANNGSGSQSQTFAVEVSGDTTVELDETLLATLSNLSTSGLNVVMPNATATGTITNDDGAGLQITNVTHSESDSGIVQYVFDVTLNANVATGVDVQYATADDTATTADGDYTPVNGTLSFTGVAGQTQSITVNVAGDTKVELSERFLLNLTAQTAGNNSVTLGQFQATGRINNDDSATVTVNDVRLAEGDSGTTDFVFEVTLSSDADVPVTLDYATAAGSARAGDDYTPTNGTISFDGSAGTQNIIVPVVADDVVELDEFFRINLSNFSPAGRNVTLNSNQITGTIADDDGILVSISDATVREGFLGTSVNFVVTRTNTTVPITVDYSTADGSATTADNDYVATSGQLNFAVGQSTATITVDVVGDHRVESDEEFFVNLSTNSFGAVLVDSHAVGTIIQDDGYIRGRKFHDINDDGLETAGEPGLDGFTFQAVDANGNILATGVSSSVDLDGNGQIDPATEQGLYVIQVNEGSWSLREAPQVGWAQVFPNSGNSLAYDLDQQLNLRFTGDFFENWGNLGEKWLFSDDGWHFITPAGNLFKWDGSPRSALTGTLVGALGAQYHASPSLLFDAQPGSSVSAVVTAGGTIQQNFGNVPTGMIEGRKFHDIDSNGNRTADEPYLNGWTINLHDADGNIIDTTVTASVDRNGDGNIDPATETGWYKFDRLVPGSYTVSEIAQPGWSSNGGTGQFAEEAYQLDQERNLRPAANSFFNWGGRQERWLWGSMGGWHFITPDGAIYQWDGSPRTALTGTLVTQFDSSYWNDISLLHTAKPSADHVIEIAGQHVTDADFGNTYAANTTGNGNVEVSIAGDNVTITGDAFANTIVVYVRNNGDVMLRGVRDTRINGENSPLLLSTGNNIGALTINMGGGHDHVVVLDVAADSIAVRTGADNDKAYIENVSATNTLELHSASGRGEFRVRNTEAGNVSFWNTGLSSIEDSEVNGSLEAVTSGTVFAQNIEVDGAVSVRTGSQADAVIASNSLFRNNVRVDAGSGNDLVALTQAIVEGSLEVNGRGGNDTIGASRGAAVSGAAVIRGGAGNDTFASSSAVGGLQLTSIESTSNSDLSSLIDEALSEFTDLMLDFDG